MRHHGPDHDPNLRAAFALDPEAQRELLNQLCGQPTAQPTPPTRPHFQPMPVTTRYSSRGACVCLPPPWPRSAYLGPDSDHLSICIDHVGFRRSQPRLPHAIAELQAALDAHGAKRGVISLPFRPPRTWTIDTLREVIALMAQHLPASASANDAGPINAIITQNGEIHVARNTRRYSAPKDGPFSTEVHVYPNAPGIQEWRAMYGNDFWAGGTFEDIDRLLAARRERLRRCEAEKTQALDDDDADPLDAIEQAARLILHPGSIRPPALPRRFTDPTRDSWKATIRQFGRLTGADPRHIATLELTVDSVTLMLLNMRTVIDRRERGGE